MTIPPVCNPPGIIPDQVATVTLADVQAIILALPAENRQAVARWLNAVVRQAVKAEQLELLMRLAAGKPGTASAVARAVASELKHYAEGQWRFERYGPPPSDERRRLMHRFLCLKGGTVPSWHTMRPYFSAH